MLAMRDHEVQDYSVLPDMDASDVGVLAADDRSCLDELGRYLAGAGAWERFGIWLLHKHFDPNKDELFVERTNAAHRRAQTAPEPKSALRETEVVTTTIRFDTATSSGVSLIGMEFTASPEFGDMSPLTDDDDAVLTGIAERLASHGKLDRFGVRLIRNPLSLSGQELLNETCDKTNRTLDYHVRDRDALLADETTIQTAWRWKVVDGEAEPAVMMDCTLTCSQTSDGHDASVIHKSYG